MAELFDIAAERQALGGALMSRDSLDDVAAALEGRDFHEPRHEAIFDAAVAVAAAGKSADPVTVADELEKRGAVGRAGGIAYLHEIVSATATAASAAYYAQIVAERAVLRRLRAAGERIAVMAEAGEGSEVDDLLNEARAAVDAVAVPAPIDDPTAVYAAIESLDEAPGIPTPWSSLSHVVTGWRPGALYVVGARPSVGKTVLGTNVALDVARRGKRAVLVSLEMPKTELYLRMLSHVGSVPGDHLTRCDDQGRRAWLTQADHESLAKAAAHIADLPLSVDDRAGLTVAQIRSKVHAAHRDGDLGIVVVDYVGMVRPSRDSLRAPRYQQIDQICDALKVMAKDYGVPIVLLAQLNRALEGRTEKIPTLADLRESGGLEQYGDVVILMHRDLLGDDPTNLVMVVAKNRHGSPAMFSLDFVGHHSRIEDRRWSPPREVA